MELFAKWPPDYTPSQETLAVKAGLSDKPLATNLETFVVLLET